MQSDAEIRRRGDTENFTESPRLRLSASLFKWLVQLCRFDLAALFLCTAGAKLWILKQFVGKVAELLSSMQMNYERWQWPVTIAVISAEIVAATLLILPRTIRWGAVLSALLLIG